MPPAKRKSAFFSATQEAQKQAEQENTVKPSSSVTGLPLSSDTVAPSQSETVTLQQSKEVTPLNSTTTKKESKTSIYFTPEEVNKLDDLAYEHKKRTGKRINRNDIVRHLVDHCSIEDLQNIE
jgi:hypothetical protein